MSRRRLDNWSLILREMKAGRTDRPAIREERLRTGTVLGNGLDLVGWRGRSGRCYVCGVHPLNDRSIREFTDCVALAVSRDESGTARIVNAASFGDGPHELPGRWVLHALNHGAEELHVHRLAACTAERCAIVQDLTEQSDIRREAGFVSSAV